MGMQQQKDGWCGPASLSYVAKRAGIPTSQKKIVKLTNTTVTHGVDPKNLVKGAKSLGFSTKTFANKSPGKTLAAISRALTSNKHAIVDYLDGETLNDGHYSVIKRISPTAISLWDPSQNKIRSINKETFIDHWKDTSKTGGIFSRWAMILWKP